MHRLTKEQARRIAVRAQLLDARRPTELLAVVRQLTLLQIDPTAASTSQARPTGPATSARAPGSGTTTPPA